MPFVFHVSGITTGGAPLGGGDNGNNENNGGDNNGGGRLVTKPKREKITKYFTEPVHEKTRRDFAFWFRNNSIESGRGFFGCVQGLRIKI
jgi:hypothetical protein